ncbi:MAG: DUF4340 domain-containing protein [Planctomycetes bacterium]|nr:DUF4340 domain-containing protein [Planctomycetota bacterium]
MNFAKANIALLVVTAALAVPTGMQLWSDAESFVDYSRIPLMFDGFTPENVGTILIAKPKSEEEQPKPNPQKPDQKVAVAYDQLLIQRSDKGWAIGQAPGVPSKLAGAPVNTQRVETDVFDHLGKIRVDQQTILQAAATEEQLAEYGLDEKSATVVRVTDPTGQNVLAALYIGASANEKLKGSEGVNGIFVRAANSTDVVLYEFERPWRLGVETDQWLERVLLKLSPEAITRFSLANAASQGKPIVLSRAEGTAAWTCDAPPAGRGAVRQAEVEGVIGRLRWISVQEFRMRIEQASNLALLGIQPPDIAFELTFKDGDSERTAKFQVGKHVDGDENVFYFASSEAPFLMTWPAGMVTPLEVDVAQNWFDPSGPPPAPQDPPPDPGKGQPADPNKK